MTTCLNFYHDLGDIIYFGNANDIFLRNTIILRPQKLVDIFNMVLNAKMPNSFSKIKNLVTFQENGEISQPVNFRLSNSMTQTISNHKWIELWENFDKRGILSDHLLDLLWKNVIDQKPGLLGLMKKFDFICEKTTFGNNLEILNREYFVPSRASLSYDHDFEEKFPQKNEKFKINGSNDYYDDFNDDDSDIDDFDDNKIKMRDMKRFDFNNIPVIEFFYDFCGFLPSNFI